MGMVSPPLKSQDRPLLPHRNNISISSNLNSSDDLELLSIKPPSHSYSSLKDLLPSVANNSPKPKIPVTRPDIRIRNRLVKQAASAYLQPMSTTPGSAGGNFFHRLWTRVVAVIDFFCRKIIQTLDLTLRVIPMRSSELQRSKMSFL